ASGKMADVLHARDSIELQVDRPHDAIPFIRQMSGVDDVTEVDRLLVITVDSAETGPINRRLVEAGSEVTELRPRQRRLEAEFLAVAGQDARGAGTEGGSDDAT